MLTRFVLSFLFALFVPFFYTAAQVADVTSPVVIPPVDQSFASVTEPVTPTLALATAIDDTDPNPIITYSPQSFMYGTTTVVWVATDTAGNAATTTSQVIVMAPVETAQIALRSGATLIGPFTITLPTPGASPVDLTPTGATSTHAVPARSVLALVSNLDAAHPEFDITDLQYYDSFASFYLKCITMGGGTPECDNWTYSVNGTFPSDGMGAHTLGNGDTAYLFFGSSHRTTLSASSVDTTAAVTATAQVYNPADNTYAPLTSVTLGVTQTDPNNPWTPIEVATSTVDANGQATFTLSTPGSYSVGIKEDYYYPTVPLTVTAVVVPAPVSGGGGGSSTPVPTTLDLTRAFAYLVEAQDALGSFGSSMITDWAAIAFANAGAPESAKGKLSAHLSSATPVLASVTDAERHAMALLAFHIDPRTGTSVDYIQKIVASFDGTQVGDVGLVNDDIFALFPLLHSGYTTEDMMIKKITSFILGKQGASGSWGSVDMTAAAVQALSLVPHEPGVSSALAKAKAYFLSQEVSNGGFGNSFATSWAMQGIVALGEDPSVWFKEGKTPHDHLASLQQPDGGLELMSSDAQTRLWATVYAISAVAEKPWHALLGSFAKPTTTTAEAGGASVSISESIVTATTTIALSTRAEAIAATTPPLERTSREVVSSTVAPSGVVASSNTPVRRVATSTVRRSSVHASNTLNVKPMNASVPPRENQQASVPENRVGGAIAHALASFVGGVKAFFGWFF